VAFAGDQGGHGLTVVVDHGNGLQMRYAHLSSIAVQPGDDVTPDRAIGQVGSSGRSTGLHLHVELIRAGQPIDPSSLLGVKQSADWKGISIRPRSMNDFEKGSQE
jgi:murein DD-endopeptidase MepM/ murein hydrolase activator NlpD